MAISLYHLALYVLFGALYVHGHVASGTWHESLENLPPGWALVGDEAPAADQPVTLKITLSHAQMASLEPVILDIADPDSSMYGKHLSYDDLRAALPDLSEVSASVMEWLQSHSINEVTAMQGDSLQIDTTVERANKLLGTRFEWYQYEDQDPVLRTQRYRIPTRLRNHIDYVYPSVHFLRPADATKTDDSLKKRQLPTGPVTCENSVCPSELVQEYNITYRPKDNKSGSRIGVGGFLEQYADEIDFQNFMHRFGIGRPHVGTYKYSVSEVNGGLNPNNLNNTGGEALLDMEYTAGVAYPLPVTFFSVGGRPPTLSQPGNQPVNATDSFNEPWLALLEKLRDMPSPPQVVSLSYSDDEQTVPERFARRVCTVAGHLAARGVSLIVASGDGGAAGTAEPEGACLGPKGQLRFIPSFPATCPWFTSVGATASYGGAAFYSGGGFSNYFARPQWQDDAVKGYQKIIGHAHSTWYNHSGRGVPDVSIVGDNYLVLGANYTYPLKGTSASTPVFAAMIALMNDHRLRNGKTVLGALNPLIYKAKVASAGFRDVTEGETEGCVYDKNQKVENGWSSSKGWDAASGIGEPNFRELIKYLG